jgi:hypothetical protein
LRAIDVYPERREEISKLLKIARIEKEHLNEKLNVEKNVTWIEEYGR